jgi:isoquinoline 1-oxidoreductase beta subunit
MPVDSELRAVLEQENPGGIGDPGTVVVQPAIANAVFAVTGVRITRMPIDRRLVAKKA